MPDNFRENIGSCQALYGRSFVFRHSFMLITFKQFSQSRHFLDLVFFFKGGDFSCRKFSGSNFNSSTGSGRAFSILISITTGPLLVLLHQKQVLGLRNE